MSALEKKTEKTAPARNQPTAGTKSAPAAIRWEGRSIPLIRERSGWRLRSRSKDFQVDINLGTDSLVEAKKIAKEKLLCLPQQGERAKGTLQQAADLYLAAPKRVSADVARRNVTRLKTVVKATWGKSLDQVRIAELNSLWPAYVATRQELPRPDYATRRPVNRGINSAMNQAAAVFLRVLRPSYRAAGLVVPDDATSIIYAAEAALERSEVDDARLIEEWRKLRDSETDLWLAVGLARFAGLRQAEIAACRGKWIEVKGAATYVHLKDRFPDYLHKTGRAYLALILDPGLAEYVAAMDKEAPIVKKGSSTKWMTREPQAWLKQFTGEGDAPLHRMRGLYADQIKRETEDAILARQAGIKEASKNLGHTTTKTTTDHYLKGDGGITSLPSPPPQLAPDGPQ